MNLSNINSQNPAQFVMVTRQFGFDLFIAPLNKGNIDATDNITDAEKWSYADTLSLAKLDYHKTATGYSELVWEAVK